jgi:hypothetical protein
MCGYYSCFYFVAEIPVFQQFKIRMWWYTFLLMLRERKSNTSLSGAEATM